MYEFPKRVLFFGNCVRIVAVSVVAGIALAGVTEGATIVGDWRFNVDADDAAVADGQLIGVSGIASTTFPAEVNWANLKDIAGNHSGFAFGQPHYAAGASVPDSVLPGFDDAALDTGAFSSQGNIYFPASATELNTNSNFSIWQRVYRQSDASGAMNEVMSSRPGAWFVFVRGSSNTLDVNFSGGLSDVFGETGPSIEVGEWYDIGVSFAGTAGDAFEDTLKVYLNGELLNSFTGTASMNAADRLHLGAAGANSLAFDGLFDRVVFWDGVASDSDFRALSVPEPSAASIWCLVSLLGGLGWWRRKRGCHLTSCEPRKRAPH